MAKKTHYAIVDTKKGTFEVFTKWKECETARDRLQPPHIFKGFNSASEATTWAETRLRGYQSTPEKEKADTPAQNASEAILENGAKQAFTELAQLFRERQELGGMTKDLRLWHKKAVLCFEKLAGCF